MSAVEEILHPQRFSFSPSSNDFNNHLGFRKYFFKSRKDLGDSEGLFQVLTCDSLHTYKNTVLLILSYRVLYRTFVRQNA